MPTIPQLPPAASVTAADEIPISQGGSAMSMAVGTLLAGTQPAIITPSGSLMGRVSAGSGGPESINIGAGLVLSGGTLAVVGQGPLPQTGSVVASDLVCINRDGVAQAVTYAQFLDGQTIDAAQPARPASDTDTFWVAQGSNIMLCQTLSSVWSWVTGKVPSYKLPVVELTTDTTLDGTVHNSRLLICSQSLTLTPAFTNMGSGFTCEILNLSTGVVNLAGGIISTTGSTSVQSGQSAFIRGVTYSGGNVVYAIIPGSGQQGLGSQSTPSPGTVTDLAISTETSSSATVSWAAPISGGPVSAYIVQYRITGAANWNVASSSVLTLLFTIGGLSASTSYDFQVSATGAGGLGLGTTITASTSASGSEGSGSSGSGSSGGSGSSSSGSSGSSGSGSSGSGSASVSSITWNVVPSGSYSVGGGSIGVNAHVSPATAPIQFGFSQSSIVPPTSWTAAVLVNTDLWGAYVPIPSTSGTWYIWGEGLDGSCQTACATAFTVS